jgi:hypothetical protein
MFLNVTAGREQKRVAAWGTFVCQQNKTAAKAKAVQKLPRPGLSTVLTVKENLCQLAVWGPSSFFLAPDLGLLCIGQLRHLDLFGCDNRLMGHWRPVPSQ